MFLLLFILVLLEIKKVLSHRDNFTNCYILEFRGYRISNASNTVYLVVYAYTSAPHD